jgi:rhamnogalacturonan endolyase
MTITAKLLLLIASISALTVVPAESIAPRQMERLGRGVVAVNQGDGKVFVSWRMLGDDPEATAFNLYRATTGAKAVKLNAKPIADVTADPRGVQARRDAVVAHQFGQEHP